MTEFRLDGKVAVVTGGSRGIGAAVARGFALAGADVVIASRKFDNCVTAANDIAEASGRRTLPVACHVGRWDDCDALVDTVYREFGPCDVLVNNAGIMPIGPLLNEPDALTRAVLDVNVLGCVFGIRALAPQMILRGQGHIVNVASAVGRLPLPGGAIYSASKAAVIALSEAFRDELRGSPIDISVILPTAVDTDLAAGVSRARGVKHLSPEEVAAAIDAAIRHPRPEVWVPRSSGVMMKTSALLPRGVRNTLSHALRADAVLSEADGRARETYEGALRHTFGAK